MTSRNSTIRRAARIAGEDETHVLADIARSRRGAGLSHAEVGRQCGMSRTMVARAEAGTRPTTIQEYARMGAAVGLDVRLRAYAAGDPIRDAGQQRLLERLRPRVSAILAWRTEVPLPIDGDRRAWDAVIRGTGWLVGGRHAPEPTGPCRRTARVRGLQPRRANGAARAPSRARSRLQRHPDPVNR